MRDWIKKKDKSKEQPIKIIMPKMIILSINLDQVIIGLLQQQQHNIKTYFHFINKIIITRTSYIK